MHVFGELRDWQRAVALHDSIGSECTRFVELDFPDLARSGASGPYRLFGDPTPW